MNDSKTFLGIYLWIWSVLFCFGYCQKWRMMLWLNDWLYVLSVEGGDLGCYNIWIWPSQIYYVVHWIQVSLLIIGKLVLWLPKDRLLLSILMVTGCWGMEKREVCNWWRILFGNSYCIYRWSIIFITSKLKIVSLLFQLNSASFLY